MPSVFDGIYPVAMMTFGSRDPVRRWLIRSSQGFGVYLGKTVTHFIKIVQIIALKGSDFADVKIELGYLVIFAVILNGLAIWNYRKTSQ